MIVARVTVEIPMVRICGYMSSFHHPICELNLTLATSEAQVPPYELLPHSLVHTHNPLVHREHLVHIGVPAYWCIYLRHGSIVRLLLILKSNGQVYVNNWLQV